MPRNIRKERRAAELTIEQVADLVGVHPNTVRGWEKGEYEPTGKNLVQLSTLFGCAADYLLDLTDERNGVAVAKTGR